jgi:hypothetical protein
VAIEGVWKFNDTGTDPGSAWRAPNFDDSSWSSGAALFFQEDAPLPAAKNTPLAPGRLAYYFRTRFVFTGDAGRVQLLLRPLVDDGAVGYLNGVEVFRMNMPAGRSPTARWPMARSAMQAYGPASPWPASWLPARTCWPSKFTRLRSPWPTPKRCWTPARSLIGVWAKPRARRWTPRRLHPPQSGAQNGTYAGLPRLEISANPARALRMRSTPRPWPVSRQTMPRPASPATPAGNDVVTIPDSGVFNFAATRTFTLEAWVNAAAAREDGAAIIAKGTGGGGEQFAIDVVGGLYRFFRGMAAARTRPPW